MSILRNLVHILENISEPKTKTAPPPSSDGLNYDEVIRNHQARERQLNDMLADQIDKIKSIEADMKRFFALYDHASPMEKKTYAVRIRALNSDLETQGKLRDSYEFKLKQEKAIIEKLQLTIVNSGMKLDPEELNRIIEDTLEAAKQNEMARDTIDMMNGIDYHTQSPKRKGSIEEKKQEDDSLSDIRAQSEGSEESQDTPKADADGDLEDIDNIRKQSNLL